MKNREQFKIFKGNLFYLNYEDETNIIEFISKQLKKVFGQSIKVRFIRYSNFRSSLYTHSNSLDKNVISFEVKQILKTLNNEI